MKIKRITGGPLPTNCYILTDETTGKSAVIDPGFESKELNGSVKSAGNVSMILLTHGHFDHISGVQKIKEITGAKVYIYSGEQNFISDGSLNLGDALFGSAVQPFKADVLLNDGDEISLGGLKIRVIHTPGHTSGGCCFIVENAVFSGDTLMQFSCGRTDCPTGSYRQILDSLQKLKNLKGNYKVYPGHGPETDLDLERKSNPYMEIGANDTFD